jgi:hypothetical protein
MRASLLSVAFAAALAATAVTPGKADAQVYLYPNVYGSLGGYGGYMYGGSPYFGYWNPGYSYGYRWANPYYNTYSYGWSNPLNYGNFRYRWYNVSPYTYGGLTRFGYNRFGRW